MKSKISTLDWTLLIVALLVAGYLVNGLIISLLWSWFVVPVFHVPGLQLAPAIGLGMLVSYMTAHYNGPREKHTPKEDFFDELARSIAGAVVVLASAFVVHLFVH